MSDRTTRHPSEQRAITIFDVPCIAVRDERGTIFLAVSDLCRALELDADSQARRLRKHRQLSKGLETFRIHTAGGFQNSTCLRLSMAGAWLLTVNTARVGDDVRDRMEYLQLHLIDIVNAGFRDLLALPERDQDIEDLDDLAGIDSALTRLAELTARQENLESSQERARDAWKSLRDEVHDLRRRMANLERQIGRTLTPAQRGYLYQLVQTWARARAERAPQTGRNVYRSCWALVHARFQVARYEDIPADRYEECVAFVRESYRSLTGDDLVLPEQSDLGLE